MIAMSSAVVQILLGVLAAATAVGGWFIGSRTTRIAAKAQTAAVDALAYDRAKDIYESALAALKNEVGDLRTQVGRLREANDLLKLEVERLGGLSTEVERLRNDNLHLRAELAAIRGNGA